MAHNHRPAPEKSASRKFTFLTIGIVAILALLTAGIIGSKIGSSGSNPASGGAESTQGGQGGQDPQSSQGGSSQQTVDMSRRTPGDPTAIGDVDAPVVMIEYSDYRCPFCALFARDTLPKLVDKYVESGKLRIEWRDFPVFGDQSIKAAVAGRAAAQQDKFWDFNKVVFAAAPERGHPDLPPERLIEFAKQAGVPDIDQFKADMKSDKLRQKVVTDAQEAASLGATGTPTFLINGRPLVGAQPLGNFKKAIEDALATAEAK
ncbi:DsbA family protein [Arthrobacter castelli]|uniref:DsbA family protein n=1 Tax=Arthrobacter castelli TaxID=271431 RepID=UPI00041C1898|nr:thioredoxin domain-containing protein [Arthrobacter castelli]